MSQVELGIKKYHYTEWFITTYYNNNNKFYSNAYVLPFDGRVKQTIETNTSDELVRPSLHLSLNVLRVSGDGSADNHFVIK